METSFALKQAADRIQKTIDRLERVNSDASIISRYKYTDRPDDTNVPLNSEGGALSYSEADLELLVSLFSRLSPNEMNMESIALGNLLDKVLSGNSVVVLFVDSDNQEHAIIYPDEAVQSFYQLAKGLYGLHLYYKEEHRPFLTEYLKRFRYRRDFFNAVKPFIPQNELKTITSDFSFNFALYCQAVYEYYFQFYSRGKEIDEAVKDTLNSLRDLEEIEFILSSISSSIETTLEFNFKASLSKPIEHIKEELDDFRKLVALAVMNMYDAKKNSFERPYHILNDYIRDRSGKIVEKEDLSKLFSRWQRLLRVYDLKSKENNSYEQIRRKLNIADPRKDYVEAERLILSATKGLFPE